MTQVQKMTTKVEKAKKVADRVYRVTIEPAGKVYYVKYDKNGYYRVLNENDYLFSDVHLRPINAIQQVEKMEKVDFIERWTVLEHIDT